MDNHGKFMQYILIFNRIETPTPADTVICLYGTTSKYFIFINGEMEFLIKLFWSLVISEIPFFLIKFKYMSPSKRAKDLPTWVSMLRPKATSLLEVTTDDALYALCWRTGGQRLHGYRAKLFQCAQVHRLQRAWRHDARTPPYEDDFHDTACC